MANLMIERLKEKVKPRVLFFSDDRRYEGIVLSIDDEYLELYDGKRDYRRFFKISKIDDLSIKETSKND